MPNTLSLFAVLLFAGSAVGGRFGSVPPAKKVDPRASYGQFETGAADIRLLAGGRKAMLLNEIVYVDMRKVRWVAPKNSVVDGASIPSAFWSFIGGPWSGEFRRASIIHDVACVKRTRSSESVHFMFYQACIRDGVPSAKAKLMYYAVFNFGPSWKLPGKIDVGGATVAGSSGPSSYPHAPDGDWTEKDVERLYEFIKERDPGSPEKPE